MTEIEIGNSDLTMKIDFDYVFSRESYYNSTRNTIFVRSIAFKSSKFSSATSCTFSGDILITLPNGIYSLLSYTRKPITISSSYTSAATFDITKDRTNVTHYEQPISWNKLYSVTANFAITPSSGQAIYTGDIAGTVTTPNYNGTDPIFIQGNKLYFAKTNEIKVAETTSHAYYTVTWRCGGYSGTVVSDYNPASYTTNPAIILSIPDGAMTSAVNNYVTVTFTVVARNVDDLNVVSTETKNILCYIPSDANPSLSVTITDKSAHTSKFGSYLQNASQVGVQSTATPKYGATIKSYTVTYSGQTVYGSNVTIVPPSSGNVNISVTATDSRGLKTTVVKTITVAAYTKPTCRITSFYRSDNAGARNENGNYCTIFFSDTIKSIISGSEKNSGTRRVYYREKGVTDYSSVVISAIASSTLAVTGYRYILSGISADKDYEIFVRTTDQVTYTNSLVYTVPVSFVMIDFDRNHKSVGIGRAADANQSLDIGFTINMHENKITNLGTPTADSDAATKKYVDDNKAAITSKIIGNLMYPVGSVYMTTDSSFNPGTTFGGTWNKTDAQGRFLLGASSSHAVGTTGGSETVTLTIDQIPRHTHGMSILQMYGDDETQNPEHVVDFDYTDGDKLGLTTDSAGGGQAHSNMPPFYTVYIWHRTA